MEIPEIEDLFDAQLIVGWEEIDDYPCWEERKMYAQIILDEEWDIIDGIYEIVDKLAGWPNWIQHAEYPNCRTCNQKMNQLVFQLYYYMVHDKGTGYIFQCSNHKEQVAFLWQC